MSGVLHRDVLKGSLSVAAGLGHALATQPTQAQTVITTPADGLVAGMVVVKTKDGKDTPA